MRSKKHAKWVKSAKNQGPANCFLFWCFEGQLQPFDKDEKVGQGQS